MLNIDALAEQYYAPYDPEFYIDTVTDAVTGEEIDPDETPIEKWNGMYFTADTFPEFSSDHPDVLEEFLDDDDPLSDFETNPAHLAALVKRAQQSMFGCIKKRRMSNECGISHHHAED